MSFLNQFNLKTPENVEIWFTLAGIGNRALALLIDYTLLGLVQFFYLLTIVVLGEILYNSLAEIFGGDEGKVFMWLFAIYSLIFFFIYLGYFIFFETVWQGQTPGKRWLKIRVIRDDGRPVRLLQATLRSLLRPVDDIFSLGLFLIIFSKSEKRLGDWAAGTIVIQDDSRGEKVKNINISPEAQELARLLQTQSQLERLSPDNFGVIREYLRRREGMLPKARIESGKTLAHRIKDIIGLENVPEGVTPSLFLEAVYLAYGQKSSDY
ncbi:MAG: hypothetical protein N5P05_002150 [Chroococcopsis gigantea SAG 12.99]|jgi:uncharacterized RDD family membrane protein YckC|nr:RDD family protein [Chlorogloea purpurea SAG 13.99]MDV3000544.1 hypothetical protein [Chroococcopsis gigantea SAG 12.99]